MPGPSLARLPLPVAIGAASEPLPAPPSVRLNPLPAIAVVLVRLSVPASELMRLAESRTGGPLPNATLCYVWDPSWPRGSVLPNAYSRRVRYITLGAALSQWQAERQDLAADFLRAFGDESPTVPALLAIAVGADADNTGGRSLGWITDLRHAGAPGP